MFGRDNVGKSTTLEELIGRIINNQTALPTLISTFPPQKNRPDLKVILPFNDKYIYVATGGDDIRRTTANVQFFSMKYSGLSIYRYDITTCSFVKINNKKSPLMFPEICISASRPNANIAQPLINFGNSLDPYNSQVVWVRKRNQQNTQNDAQDLMDLVNRIHKNKMV